MGGKTPAIFAVLCMVLLACGSVQAAEDAHSDEHANEHQPTASAGQQVSCAQRYCVS